MNFPPSPTRIAARRISTLLILTVLGMGTELILLGHYEGIWQIIPLVLFATDLVILVWYRTWPTLSLRRIARGSMVLTAVSGVLGLVLHYRGNTEFELELSPGIAGLELFRETMTGATPVLAPGTMALVGLLGLIYLSLDSTVTSSSTRVLQ